MKCVVASYWFSAAKTGASASREWSSCVGFGSFAFMYTTKWLSEVKRAIWPFASRRSAEWAYASMSSRMARRSAASLGEMASCSIDSLLRRPFRLALAHAVAFQLAAGGHDVAAARGAHGARVAGVEDDVAEGGDRLLAAAFEGRPGPGV